MQNHEQDTQDYEIMLAIDSRDLIFIPDGYKFHMDAFIYLLPKFGDM